MKKVTGDLKRGIVISQKGHLYAVNVLRELALNDFSQYLWALRTSEHGKNTLIYSIIYFCVSVSASKKDPAEISISSLKSEDTLGF